MKDTLDNLVISTIRTFVPSFVGTFVILLADRGITLSDAEVAGAVSSLVAGCVALYYVLVRIAAQKFPKLEWLLGAPKAPVYDKGETVL